MHKSCLNCKHSYYKDVGFNEKWPEYVVVCGEDNAYIGYEEDAQTECCEDWKERA